jgi:porphobilinogen deaminase
MLRIGTFPDSDNLRCAEAIRLTLLNCTAPCEFLEFSPPKGEQGAGWSQSCLASLETALLRGEIDFFTWPLHELPPQRVEGTLIAALSTRSNPAAWLLVPKQAADYGELFALKKGALVWISAPVHGLQLKSFRPDVQLAATASGRSILESISLLRQGAADAWLVPTADIVHLQGELDAMDITRFNTRELLPPPGSGVLACLCCSNDLSTRSALRGIHHPEVAQLTNVERKILRLLDNVCPDSIGAYCERDGSGYYHAWACLQAEGDPAPRQARCSQSTHYHLAERIAEELIK